jgi:hypothetical protein
VAEFLTRGAVTFRSNSLHYALAKSMAAVFRGPLEEGIAALFRLSPDSLARDRCWIVAEFARSLPLPDTYGSSD